MSVKVQVSGVIDRPVAKVFHLFADEHVRNHPRWDPLMQLEQTTDGPIGVGTIIKRINSHSGSPVEGTMEVVAFEPNRAFGMIIHDGPVEIIGTATYEAVSDNRSRYTLTIEFPGMDESMAGILTGEMEKAIQIHKRFFESEVSE
ncbi:MAG: SRPBCC family protein [Anaerolineae bacterium]|nr:SRPBCC family protein [Anaerolineae bacterium]